MVTAFLSPHWGLIEVTMFILGSLESP